VARLRNLEPADADDIVQDVMLAVTAHIGEFRYDRDRGKFRQWVRRIAEAKIIDHYRRKAAQKNAELEDVHADDRPSFDELWEEEWRLQDLHWCLDQIAADIAPRRMDAFRSYVLEGQPAREIAARLEMTEGYVYVTRYHVLQLIRKKMGQLDGRD
jgi:RNA polymerase sigma-70 factor (ECF subfamily)